MVDELAKIEFVFPFNLREDSTMNREYLSPSQRSNPDLAPLAFAHPDPDHQVRTFLETCRGTDYRLVAMYYCAFFISLFDSASQILDECPLHKRREVASWWRGYLEEPPNRSSFYKKVIKQCHGINESLSSQADTDAARSGHLMANAEESEDIRAWNEAAILRTHEELGQERVTEASRALLTKVREFCNREDALIVLYFDEFDTLHRVLDPYEKRRPRRTRYTTLWNALDFLAWTKGVFSLFLSRDAHFEKPVEIPSPLPSWTRINPYITDNMQAPYTNLPFDCSPAFPIRSRTISLAESNEIAHLCQFGRPL